MAKRRFDFDADAAPAPAKPPEPPAPPASTPKLPASTRAAGLRRKLPIGTQPAVSSVLESRDRARLATLYADGKVENPDNRLVLQFRANGDVEDAGQRVQARLLDTTGGREIRNAANRVMAVLRGNQLERESGEILAYFSAGRIENEAHQIVGYYTGATTAPATPSTPASAVTPLNAGGPETHLAVCILLCHPNLWQDDQP